MTIKRRLFLSNMLMLVMPIIITILTFSCVIFILMSVTGIKDSKSFHERNVFYSAISQAESVYEAIDLTNFQSIKSNVDKFNEAYKDFNIALLIYERDALIYPSHGITNRAIELALSESYDTLIIEGTDAVNSAHMGEYTFLLTSTNLLLYSEGPLEDYFYIGILLFAFSILIVFIINRALTRFVSKRITTPLDLLVSGVHELRDGNLSFRIEYNYNDEFKSLCDDFNVMADRLLESVNRRQKDDINRKELIAGISHDLRTPLTSIKAYIEGLERDVAVTSEKKRNYFNIINSKTNELENIINQLFMFSKVDIGEFPFRLEEVNIYNELTEIATVFSGENVDYMVSILSGDTEAYASVDVQQFRNAIRNVLENSIKYKNKEQGMVEISCHIIGRKVVIELTDNGPGVPDETLDKLFDVFYRSDPARNNTVSGSGLGLAITAKVVEGFGGHIVARNAVNGGLSIIIELPYLRKGY